MVFDLYGYGFTLELWHVALLYAIGFPIITYLHLGLYYYINGGSVGRHSFWFPYQNLWQDIEWNFLPGASEKRVAWMKRIVTHDAKGWFSGVDFDDIRTNDRYLEMSYKVTNKGEFLFRMFGVLAVGALVAPFVVPIVLFMILGIPIVAVADKLGQLWKRSFTYTLS